MQVSKKKSSASVMIILPDHDRRVEFRKMAEGQFGLTVFSVADPLQGLVVLQNVESPNFLLLSSGDLPMMNYLDFLVRKANVPGIAQIPVVLLSQKPRNPLPNGVAQEVIEPLGDVEFAKLVKIYCS